MSTIATTTAPAASAAPTDLGRRTLAALAERTTRRANL